ncbi:unnamed protein product [marine sediment metagenome]|uniref:Uncharacterized protein n=1 Tax=marine sediment metagenome TaxID=412755 RepID=X1B5F1_9ZZZZ
MAEEKEYGLPYDVKRMQEIAVQKLEKAGIDTVTKPDKTVPNVGDVTELTSLFPYSV